MGDNITLPNGLSLGGLFQEKEEMIRKLQAENEKLREEKAQLKTENQTSVLEQAMLIEKLNLHLSKLTGEQTKHFNTIDLLESVKLEKQFLEEELQLHYDYDKKRKEKISELETELQSLKSENSLLHSDLNETRKVLSDEKKENTSLSCLVGERDVTIEKLQTKVTKLSDDNETLKHALASKDGKLKSVLDERNKAQWKLQDHLKHLASPIASSKKKMEFSCVRTPPRLLRSKSTNGLLSSSPTTVVDISPDRTIISPSVPNGDGDLHSFVLKEKHYLSVIYRLRSEVSRLRGEVDQDGLSSDNKLKSTYIRNSPK